jgi:predicted anti-sigma-YlaC factor YlaD
MDACDDVKDRLSAYLDGELTQQESQRVDVHVRECPRCRAVLDDFRQLRGDIKDLGYPEPKEAEWSRVMAGFTFKATRGLGWLLWIGGAVVLVAYGIYAFATDDTVKAFERVVVLAVLLGVMLVFVTVLAERLSSYKHDKYKDIQK